MAKAKRERRVDHGDFPEGSPLADAVDRFRRACDLHDASPDDALVRFAFGAGSEFRGADEVRRVAAKAGWTTREDAPDGVEKSSRDEETRETQNAALGLTSPASQPIETVDVPPEGDRGPDPGSIPTGSGGCHHEVQERDEEGWWFCRACGEVLGKRIVEGGSEAAPCDHDYRTAVFENEDEDDDRVRLCQRCSTCGETAVCLGGIHFAICTTSEMVYCTTCGEMLNDYQEPDPDDEGEWEIVDLGVSEHVVLDPKLVDVDHHTVVEQRRTGRRYVGPPEPIAEEVDAETGPNENTIDEQEILF